MKYLETYLVPAGGPALDERPDCDAVAVPVARQVRPEERHVVDLATLVDTEERRGAFQIRMHQCIQGLPDIMTPRVNIA